VRYGSLLAALILLNSCLSTPTPAPLPTPSPISSPTTLPPLPTPTNTISQPKDTPAPPALPTATPAPIELFQYGFAGPDLVWLVVGNKLLGTTDNGRHWDTLYQSDTDWIDQVAFVDEQHGWIGADGTLKATTDGGQHWVDQQPYTTLGYPPTFSFISAQQGWVSREGTLQMTTDSGTTWRDVHANQAVWAAQFFDAQHGWGFLTNEPLMPDPALGYSSDGGQTWLPRTSPPCRWSKGRGVFSFSGPMTAWAACGPDNGGEDMASDLHKTENGGEMWSKVSPLNAGMSGEGVVWVSGLCFLDDQHGWILVGSDKGDRLLRATSDGGHTWQTVAAPAPWLEYMRFATPTRGYAIRDLTTLMGTQDGGATWTPLYSTVGP
jgi:photosystem II stability/assembly factor-like uncharacterized protein